MSTALTDSFGKQREDMVRLIQRRGIRDEAICDAFRNVRREAFLPEELREFAYRDSPLPIGNEQTISQPYVVALMTAALDLEEDDRVLEIGTGSGYAAAILGEIASEVFTVERYEELAKLAAERLESEGFANVHVRHGDGTLGWPEHAPYDAVIVAAGGPEVPQPLLDQLAIGGRLVIPVGSARTLQQLIRVTKTGESDYDREDLGDVRFVPLVGTAGWKEEEPAWDGQRVRSVTPERKMAELISEAAEPFADVGRADLSGLLDRIGNCHLVLIGEATHGTSEFYRMRARITQELIEHRGFNFVAVEADWPDAARVNRYVQGGVAEAAAKWQAFARFPTWMWRNREVLDFVEWLREYNEKQSDAVGFFGLDLYSMYTSIAEVLSYLDRVDPDSARRARQRYGCLSPWEGDPETYGRVALSGEYRKCEGEVARMLQELLERRMEFSARDGMQYFDAAQNAKLVANAEKYYRRMYYGGTESWNLRDTHMFETLQSLMSQCGPDAKGIVWEHNSHLGDAAATEMGQYGEINVGHLCREYWGDDAYLIGQGTDHGTVAAASGWDAPVDIMRVRPSQEGSYERHCHESGVENFFLPLRSSRRAQLREELAGPLLERAIGVVYRPQTEIQSHYFHASLPQQFDEWIWFDESQAVQPVLQEEARQYIPPHPFSLVD